MSPSLAEIYRKYPQTDKDSVHSYVSVYENILAPYRQTAQVVCEIGILYGDSLRAWRDYFPNAVIVGLDADPRWLVTEPRISSVHGKAPDLKDLSRLPAKIDVVIDDGDHNQCSQVLTLAFLWPRLSPGGIYIIEDIQRPEFLEYFRCFGCEAFDLRGEKGRQDDILAVMRKGQGSL